MEGKVKTKKVNKIEVIIDDPVFGLQLLVLIGKKRWCQRKIDRFDMLPRRAGKRLKGAINDVDGTHGLAIFTTRKGLKYFMIWIRPHDDVCTQFLGTLQHEVMHITNWYLSEVGMPPRKDKTYFELSAYYAQFLYNAILIEVHDSIEERETKDKDT